MSVANNTFENIGPVAAPPGGGSPSIAIAADQSSTSYIGVNNLGVAATGWGNTFNKCQIGVFAQASNTIIAGNTFTNIWESINIGFNSTIPPSVTTNINTNHFNLVRGGIYLKDVAMNAVTNIYNNNMVITSPIAGPASNIDYYAIYYANTNQMYTGSHIYDNIITNPRYGIWLSNCGKDLINKVSTGNIIYFTAAFNNTYTYYGVRIQKSPSVDISSNTIRSFNLPPTSLTLPDIKGISVETSTGTIVYENKMTNMATGIYAFSGCNGSSFTCNTNDGCWNGFNFSSATIGLLQGTPTSSSNNKWEGNLIPGGNQRFITGNLSTPLTNWFYNAGANYDPTGTNTPVALIPFMGYPLTPVPSGCNPPALRTPIENREEMLGKIMRNEMIYDTLIDEFKLRDSIFAYQQLNDDTTMLHLGTIEDGDYQVFYDYLKNSNIAKFKQIKDYVLDTIYPDTSAARLANQNVPTRCSMQENQKLVNSIYLNEMNNYNDSLGLPNFSPYDSTETYQLQSVAYQNPLLGGDAVYMARIMLFIDVIDDNGGGDKSMIYKPQLTTLPKMEDYKMYPNPNSGTMQLSYTLGTNENGAVTITNVLGEKIASYKLVGGSTLLNISETQLNNGIYFYEVYKNTQKVYSGKIVISK